MVGAVGGQERAEALHDREVLPGERAFGGIVHQHDEVEVRPLVHVAGQGRAAHDDRLDRRFSLEDGQCAKQEGAVGFREALRGP